MATESLSTLDGFFKRQYDDEGVVKPLPEFAILQKDIPFRPRDKVLGDDYQIDVRTARSYGWTFNGGSNRGTEQTLVAAKAGQTKPARVKGFEFIDRIKVPYGVITKAQSSESAFAAAFDELVMTMEESAKYALEMSIMYAGTHIGAMDGDPGTGAVPEPITITKATFCQGLWAQSEGMPLDVYDSTLTTLRNSVSGDLSVSTTDGTRTGISLTGTQASFDAIATTDVALPAGAKGNWNDANCAGIKKILENTGTLFELDAATYGVWKATRFDAGGVAASLTTFNRAAAQSLGRGGWGKFTFYLSHFTWTDLNVDHAALRRLTGKEQRDLVIGSESISYIGPNGLMELKVHPMMMAGESWGLRLGTWERGGSSDYTHRLPGMGDGADPQFFLHVPDKNSWELRGMWDQFPSFCKQPAKQVQIHNIVNNSL